MAANHEEAWSFVLVHHGREVPGLPLFKKKKSSWPARSLVPHGRSSTWQASECARLIHSSIPYRATTQPACDRPPLLCRSICETHNHRSPGRPIPQISYSRPGRRRSRAGRRRPPLRGGSAELSSSLSLVETNGAQKERPSGAKKGRGERRRRREDRRRPGAAHHTAPPPTRTAYRLPAAVGLDFLFPSFCGGLPWL